ncbi:MAG: 3-hydroxyacyl-CoA dehydrogenase NAD-binding domain-containing protein [Desulfomonilaceae bacterium]
MDKPLERVTLVKSGILGTQIAIMAAHAGYAVTVYDPREDAFTATYSKIKCDLNAKQEPLHPVGGMGEMQGSRSESNEPG